MDIFLASPRIDPLEYVYVTEDNLAEVAEWSEGVVLPDADGVEVVVLDSDRHVVSPGQYLVKMPYESAVQSFIAFRVFDELDFIANFRILKLPPQTWRGRTS